MTVIRETIRETHQTLEAAGIPDARLEAEVMVMTVMRMTRQNLVAEQAADVPASEAQQLAGIVAQRLEADTAGIHHRLPRVLRHQRGGDARRADSPAPRPRAWWSTRCSWR